MVNEDWNVSLPPEDWVRLLDDLVEFLPDHARRLGITPEMAAEMRRQRDAFRAERNGAMQLALEGLGARLAAHGPEARWAVVVRECFARLMITREPERTRMMEVLEKWVEGIERASGGDLRVGLKPGFFKDGLRFELDRPRLCDAVTLYWRRKGRAPWEFLCTDTQPAHCVFTAPREDDLSEDITRRGSTMQFVAIGCLEWKLIGWPGDIVEMVVPKEYPIVIPPKGNS